VSDYLEGALSPSDQLRLETHLAACPHCSAYLAQVEATIRAAGHARPDDLEPEVVDELVSLYRRWRSE
jgi:anti-sigma factor RsiW